MSLATKCDSILDIDIKSEARRSEDDDVVVGKCLAWIVSQVLLKRTPMSTQESQPNTQFCIDNILGVNKQGEVVNQEQGARDEASGDGLQPPLEVSKSGDEPSDKRARVDSGCDPMVSKTQDVFAANREQALRKRVESLENEMKSDKATYDGKERTNRIKLAQAKQREFVVRKEVIAEVDVYLQILWNLTKDQNFVEMFVENVSYQRMEHTVHN